MARSGVLALAALLAALALLTGSLVRATVMDCPAMQCDPGWFLNGKFVDRDYPWDEAKDEYSGVLQIYYFDLNDFCDAFPSACNHKALGGYLSDGNAACNLVCSMEYNTWAKDSGAPQAGYWMFEQTCDYGVGGQCMCMHSDSCADGTQWWSDEAFEDAEWGQYFSLPASYTTGKLCETTVKGDPHFRGADGSNFEFSGIPNRAFAVISDSHVHVNAFFGGRYGQWDNRTKAMTWMRKIAVLWGHHVAVLTARSGGDPEYGSGYLDSIVVDGEPIEIQPHTSATAVDGEFSVSWTKAGAKAGKDRFDQFQVAVGGTLSLRLTIRPEVWNLRIPEDAAIHFDVDVESAHFSSNVHGILGQTYRGDFAGRLAEQTLIWNPQISKMVVPGDNAEGFIDGVVEDYLVSDLIKTQCKFCLFTRGVDVDEETANAMALSTLGLNTFTSRKLLDASR